MAPKAQATSGETKLAVSQKLINKMWRFNQLVKTEDCAGITGHEEPTQYTEKHKSLKRKASGKQPADYNAVELLVDFRAAMNAGNYEEAVPLYFHLRRMLNWGG